ncbi:hypothetical protein [Fodinibius salsisoli]|uniref:Right handed beta helix region n=1 Tax=Fodinibius salsisoli TaxID=2820877 RepID=A0ABT3PRR6_9BACT|nr:hypothetical protein [Fodinibius salsisoli]MCW9708553.1 hypothetical protein [Fodinibius salsisoli]
MFHRCFQFFNVWDYKFLRMLSVGVYLLLPTCTASQNTVHSGEFIVEPPTLENLGFEWKIDGDDNRNAEVLVEYRAAGSDSDWKQGMPLLRIGGEKITERAGIDYVTPAMFAGSILDLHSDTEYECRFTLRDPDGVEGEAVKTVTVRTRAEPKEAHDGRILHVYPQHWKGEKQEPAFTGLMEAYNGSQKAIGDWYLVDENQVKPGDIIMLHGGLYRADRSDYINPESIPFDGTYFLTAKGTAQRPIVIKAAGDGEVLFDGAGAHTLFNVMATEHHIFEGITFINADRVFDAGRKKITGANGLTIRNCRFEEVGEAIRTEYAGSKNFYIVDNLIIGRNDRYRLLGWTDRRHSNPGPYGKYLLNSYMAIKVYGSGHVIAYNSIAYFHDGISISTYGSPEQERQLRAVSIDIYNNDIHLVNDDFIEADGGVHNIRIMRNRGVNAAQSGLSAQPLFGGPAYFIRNVLYHIPSGGAFKFYNQPAGLVAYHNTFIADITKNLEIHSNSHFRNNLFLSRDHRKGIAVFPFATSYSTSDYNGYRPNQGVERQYVWITPSLWKVRDYSLSYKDSWSFETLEGFSRTSGLEEHGITVDYNIFKDLQQPDPQKPHTIYHATDLNFKLKPNSKAVDAGMKIPNVNDDSTGKAPDLGALEVGLPTPIFGCRGHGRALDKPFYR